jgi:hypothetical protein
MSAYVCAADAIRDAFGCLVVIVHHCGLDTSRPRGHTSLAGAADAQICVKRDTAGTVVAEVEFMKDGEAGARLVSRLAVVEVGQDEDGEPITSCSVEPVDSEAALAKVSKSERLPKAARIALDAFWEAIDEYGKLPPPEPQIPAGVKAVALDDWREFAVKRGVSDSEKPDSARAAFRRAMQHLVTAGKIGVWDSYAWAIKA